MQVKSIAEGEHSAIPLTFITLPFTIKIFVLSVFEWPLKTGFTVGCFVCVFDLILYVPSTIFQFNRDGSSWVEPVLSLDKCVLLKDHNAVTPVRLEPAASLSQVKHSTTEPLRSQDLCFVYF